MPGTSTWQPMKRTVDLIKLWYPFLVRGKLTPKDVEALQMSIIEGSISFRPTPPPGKKQTYSDESYKPIEAVLDFALAISKCMSQKGFFQLTETILTSQFIPHDYTSLRGNELARFLLIIEMGMLCKTDKSEIPNETLAHLSHMTSSLTNESLKNLVNNLMIHSLMTFHENYHGLSHLKEPKLVSVEQMDACRTQDWNIVDELDDRRPKQPRWLDSPKLAKKPLIIETMFKEANAHGKSGKMPAQPLHQLLR